MLSKGSTALSNFTGESREAVRGAGQALVPKELQKEAKNARRSLEIHITVASNDEIVIST